ncbi:hypothetical protein QVD17_36144 [Tagetes erecta]|uniref:AAA+ ATPase domain-containing protein n=1 Tax=Tagetes erecta TaxID=13708 RepID=A0AAD8JVS2_TARER|nr:hypothetical protein QVD17_36144 [Tagetes erecta]
MPPSASKSRNAKKLITTLGSVLAAVTVINTYLPKEFRDYIIFGLRNVLNKFSTQLTIMINEYEGFRYNEIYTATQIYLSDRITTDVHRLKVAKSPKEQRFNVAMDDNEEYIDVYNGVEFSWCSVSEKTKKSERDTRNQSEHRSFRLAFHRKHRDVAMDSYLPFVVNEAKKRKLKEKSVRLFTVDSKWIWKTWTSVNLDHPATFETVAMDAGVKEMVMKDLDTFLEREEYYRRVGKAWKRGYLLYGPPGTGKSSLIAAMANYLKFDIYDLELTSIKSNSELRRLLVATANRSILVVEDIDCSVELHDRVCVEPSKAAARKNQRRGKEQSMVTLSGFLNFIDGLWSSCGDERIIIFTTNRKDKLDPALIRPGRMDVHIHMSYCTPSAFRVLVSNYLNITEHNLFKEIDVLISEVNVTPAQVAEQLLKDDDPEIVLRGLVKFFYVKKENEEAQARLKEEETTAKEKKKEKENDQEDEARLEEEESAAKEKEKENETEASLREEEPVAKEKKKKKEKEEAEA